MTPLRRVAITGIGLVTPIGIGVEAVWANALAGTSGARPVSAFDPSRLPTRVVCDVPDFDPAAYMDGRQARRMDRFAQFAVAAAGLALEDAALDPAEVPEAGVYIGSGIGGLTTFVQQTQVMLERGPDRLSPFFIPMIIPNMGAAQVSMQYKLRGPLITTVSACATANHAIGEALDAIRLNRADVILAGGSETSINEIGLAAFNAMRALSTRNDDPQGASRPFDAGRDGFVMGEAGAVLVLEELEHARARGARIHAELSGYGLSGDAHHLTEPDPSGIAPTAALRMALRDAGVAPEEVGYINAHATSTPIGDPNEIRVIRMTLGDELASRCLVSSTKSMHGHCLGAAGGVEAALTALALRDGRVPPTINLTDLDPACEGVDHVANTAREADIRVALSNGFGFGGHNAALVLRRWDG
ncbi:MAG: beta-ketoacyl-ACP synthase II [Thermoleophilia bacterium]